MNAAANELLAKQDRARQIEAEIMALTEVNRNPLHVLASLGRIFVIPSPLDPIQLYGHLSTKEDGL